jgi:polysaccharide pyruvyl transferase WcaK-like protein
MSKRKIFFSIKTQFGNLGDALINRLLIREALKYGDVIIDGSRCPKSFIDTLGISESFELVGNDNNKIINSYLQLFYFVVFNRINNEDVYFFLNPGGLGQSLSLKSKISTYINNVLLHFYKLIGVKVCQVGVSFDKMNRTELLLQKMRSNALHKLYVRDNGSHKYLSENNFKLSGVYPDLAFYLCDDEFLNYNNENNNSVCFSFRVDENNLDLHNLQLFLDEANSYFDDSYCFIFLSQVDRDNIFMKDIHKWFSENYLRNSEMFICSDNIDINSDVYKKCKYIFSNRLHVLLLGASNGACPVAVISKGYNKKIENLFLDIDLDASLLYFGEDFDLDKIDNINWKIKLKKQYEIISKMLPNVFNV